VKTLTPDNGVTLTSGSPRSLGCGRHKLWGAAYASGNLVALPVT